MANKLPYDTTADALLRPAQNASFFQGWNPATDNQNHDLLCAEISRLAYAGQSVVAPALASIGFSTAGFIDVGGTQGFVANNPSQGLTVLAFRGTESNGFQDLISDLDTMQDKFVAGGRVHAGFLKAYGERVQQQVKTLLGKRETTLLVTGHSLGAALATLAAHDVHPNALITFGSPRVGDAGFTRLFDGLSVHRFVNCCDIVGRIPPEQFDHEHLLQLLTEVGDLGRFQFPLSVAAQASAQAAAVVLAAASLPIASSTKFEHIAPPRYIRADGTLAEHISGKEISQGQQKARADYRATSEARLSLLQTLFDSLRTPRDLISGLFDLDDDARVPLRDLADHAPINYVSAFTGRSVAP